MLYKGGQEREEYPRAWLSVNINQLRGTGKTAMCFQVKGPKISECQRQGDTERTKDPLSVEPKLKCPCHVHSQELREGTTITP